MINIKNIISNIFYQKYKKNVINNENKKEQNYIEIKKINDYESCLSFVKKDGHMIKFVNFENLTNEQARNICLISIQQKYTSYKFIENITLEMYIKIEELHKTDIQSDGHYYWLPPDPILSLKNKKLNPEIYEYIVNKNPSKIKDIKFQNAELCKLAVEKNHNLLIYVLPMFRTLNLCLPAVNKSYYLFICIPNITLEIFEHVIELYNNKLFENGIFIQDKEEQLDWHMNTLAPPCIPSNHPFDPSDSILPMHPLYYSAKVGKRLSLDIYRYAISIHPFCIKYIGIHDQNLLKI